MFQTTELTVKPEFCPIFTCAMQQNLSEYIKCDRKHNKHTKYEENIGNWRKKENQRETLLFTRQENDGCIYKKK